VSRSDPLSLHDALPIFMQFDECTPYQIDGRPATSEEAAKSMRMSLRWAKRSLDEFNREENPNALFGIVQGGMFEQLRDESLAGRSEEHTSELQSRENLV